MRKVILHIVLPIFIGSMIYVLFREKNLLMFDWFGYLKVGFIIDFLRNNFYEYRIYIPKSVLFSFPDALWVYSFTMFLSIYFKNKIILSTIFIGSIITEISQLWFVIGTFDIYDVIYMFALYLIAMYFIKKFEEKKIMKKKVGLILGCILFVILAVGSVPTDSGKTTSKTDATTSAEKKEVIYEKVTAKELIDALQDNALNAKEKYKDKYVEITGKLNVIDASGKYITVNPIGDDFVLTGVQAYIKTDEQKQVVSGLSKGDKITVKGKVKDVGEVLGYSVDIDEISKTANK